ncbi:MAG: penicillin-binding transpeptidase domain-containing protein [Actinomycetota bacterium]|nr:penicillin-binding transpeptidase domain-containing protein [Actinomycetota bacterium]
MPERRRRLLRRTLFPLIGVSLLAFAVGLLVGRSGGEPGPSERFAEAWERQDFVAMHAELSPESRSTYPLETFTELYVDAQSTATATTVATDEVTGADGGDQAFEVTVATLAFGSVPGEINLPLDDQGQIEWEPHLVFPGLDAGELLERVTRVAQRAPLLAHDGTPLAEGPESGRTSPLGAAALSVAGTVGTPSRKQERELFALGFPPGSLTGTSGLELAFNQRLAGQPGGQLFATADPASQGQGRELASGDPVAGEAVKTTIDPEAQEAAVAALGATFGGVAVLDARNGDVLGVAGLAWSEPQPPGSTFKVITAAAALDAGVVELDDEFPIEVSNSEIGREISNAHDSPCGGTLTQSFAQSCNTVFAPLGVRAGADAMFEKAQLFGFNEPPALASDGALEAIAPPPSSYPQTDSDVALGESAIGQGMVLATPLQMASVAQTIANEGIREPTSIVRSSELRSGAEPVEVTPPETAATINDLMVEVVRSGTGVAGQVPGTTVAGKTGTAELGPTSLEPGQTLAPGEDPPQKENAWFTAFAPADKPEVAIAAVVFDATGGGGGGAVAAPIAQRVLAAVLAE